jgi:hypothetical protein
VKSENVFPARPDDAVIPKNQFLQKIAKVAKRQGMTRDSIQGWLILQTRYFAKLSMAKKSSKATHSAFLV